MRGWFTIANINGDVMGIQYGDIINNIQYQKCDIPTYNKTLDMSFIIKPPKDEVSGCQQDRTYGDMHI